MTKEARGTPETILRVHIYFGQLPGTDETRKSNVIRGVERVPKKVAVELGGVLPKEVHALLVGRVTDLRIGPRLQKLRRELNALLIRVKLGRPERRQGRIGVGFLLVHLLFVGPLMGLVLFVRDLELRVTAREAEGQSAKNEKQPSVV